jgi:hypothetical protein
MLEKAIDSVDTEVGAVLEPFPAKVAPPRQAPYAYPGGWDLCPTSTRVGVEVEVGAEVEGRGPKGSRDAGSASAPSGWVASLKGDPFSMCLR